MSDYLPRVSDVLAMLYPGSLAFVPQEALEAGTVAHAAMECWANNMSQGFVAPAPHEERVARAIAYLGDVGFLPTLAEFRLTSKMGYCGTIDVKGEMAGERWIVDFKFAEAITEANIMQLDAYVRMAKEYGKVDRAGLLHVPKTGPVTLTRYRPNARLWHAFLSGVNVLRFQNSRRPQIIFEDIQPTEVEHG